MITFLQRVANALGVLLPPRRALKFGGGFVLTDCPDASLTGSQGGNGQVTGFTLVESATAAAPMLPLGRRTVNASSNLAAGELVVVGSSGLTMTLPLAASVSSGATVIVTMWNHAHVCAIAVSGSNSINMTLGADTQQIGGVGPVGVIMVSDGVSDWFALGLASTALPS